MKKVEATNDVAEISDYVKWLSSTERKALLKGLRKKILLAEARELSKSVNKNVQISMEDILKEIKTVHCGVRLMKGNFGEDAYMAAMIDKGMKEKGEVPVEEVHKRLRK